ncbi:MAG: peptide-methionine (S)-S-oxide reductase MsrA [Acidobacteriota bacterium]
MSVPAPVVDDALASKSDQKMAVFAGGCFWGIQAVFQHVNGVVTATSGYAGGSEATARYELVSNGNTGHAESVQVIYDPSKVTYGTLLRVFFSVAHDPTEVNRQGPDDGPQYRSAVFTVNPEQEKIVKAYIAQLDGASVFASPIATKVTPLDGFYAAEEYHQNYATNHPTDPYIVINDRPKVVALRKQFPTLYKR